MKITIKGDNILEIDFEKDKDSFIYIMRFLTEMAEIIEKAKLEDKEMMRNIIANLK